MTQFSIVFPFTRAIVMRLSWISYVAWIIYVRFRIHVFRIVGRVAIYIFFLFCNIMFDSVSSWSYIDYVISC